MVFSSQKWWNYFLFKNGWLQRKVIDTAQTKLELYSRIVIRNFENVSEIALYNNSHPNHKKNSHRAGYELYEMNTKRRKIFPRFSRQIEYRHSLYMIRTHGRVVYEPWDAGNQDCAAPCTRSIERYRVMITTLSLSPSLSSSHFVHALTPINVEMTRTDKLGESR